MRFLWSESWEIHHGEPLHLVLALFIRDAAGLGAVGDPRLPPLDPPVSVRALPPMDLQAARRQWADWWRRRWSEDQRSALQKLNEVGLPAFEDLPELRELLLRLLDEAGRWSSERHEPQDESAIGRGGFESHEGLGHLVRHRERQLRRRARPFRLSITQLPVSGKTGWRVGPAEVVVTPALVRDREAFLGFVRPLVEELA